MSANPESMRPTMASRHERVIEANQIVGMEAFKVMEEGRIAQNAVVYESAQKFLNGAEHKKRRK